MKKLDHKLLPCIFCTIGLNCYVAGHNLVHASVKKLTGHKNLDSTNNNEEYTASKNDEEKVT